MSAEPDPVIAEPEGAHQSLRDRLRAPLRPKVWHGYALGGALGVILALVVGAGFFGALYLRGQSKDETDRNAAVNRAQSQALANLRRIQALERPPSDREVAAAAGRALAACARNPACRNAFRGAVRRSRLRPSDVPALTPDDSAAGDTTSGGSGSGGSGGSGGNSDGGADRNTPTPRAPTRTPQPTTPAPRRPRPATPPAPSPTAPARPTPAPAPQPTPQPPTTVPSTPVTPPVPVPVPTPPLPGLPPVCSPIVTVNCPQRVARELARGRVGEAIEEAAEIAQRALPRCEDAPQLRPPACRAQHSGPG